MLAIVFESIIFLFQLDDEATTKVTSLCFISLPISAFSSSWRVLKTDRTKVVVETMIDVGHVRSRKSPFHMCQCILGRHANRPVRTTWFVQVKATAMHFVAAI